MFSCGKFAVMFISKGDLYVFGISHSGVLGDYNKKYHIITDPFCIAHNVRQVSINNLHAVFVTNDDDMYGLGNGRYGRLGDKNTFPHVILAPIFIEKGVKKVFTSHYNTMFITSSDVLYGLGDAMNGKMNDNIKNNHDVMTPLRIHGNVHDVRTNTENAILMKCDDGGIWIVGMTNYNQDLNGYNISTKTHLTTLLINKEGEKVGDFDISDTNIAFIIK